MIKLVPANCPNCGASVELNPHIAITKCKYCKCTILVDGVLNINKQTFEKDELCMEISKKLNKILELYVGNKNEMLLMLKDRIGLVNSGRTTAKIAMMQTANDYKEEEFDSPFVYRIETRTLDHFEYKNNGVVELTYESNEAGLFALEYYGKIKKISDKKALSLELDKIIEEVKRKFSN